MSFISEKKSFKTTRGEIENLPHVQCVDRDGDLDMFCYDADMDLDRAGREIQQTRGLIFDGDDLVVKTFPYSPMYLGVSHKQYIKHYASATVENGKKAFSILPKEQYFFLQNHWSDCLFYPAQEGTLIRVFHHNGKWYFATHRRLNADRCFWGGKTSFQSIFVNGLRKLYQDEESNDQEILDELTRRLDPSIVYVFLIKSVWQTRIVSFPDNKEPILLVGTFSRCGNTFDSNFSDIPNIPSVQRMSFSNISDLYRKVEQMPPEFYQGVLVVTPHGECWKICSYQYLHRYIIRGNVESVKYRYLQLLNYPTFLDTFRQMYPDKTSEFDEYEDILDSLAETFANDFNTRYNKGGNNQLFVDQKEHHFLLTVRSFHGYREISAAEMREYIITEMTTQDLNYFVQNEIRIFRQLDKLLDSETVEPEVIGENGNLVEV